MGNENLWAEAFTGVWKFHWMVWKQRGWGGVGWGEPESGNPVIGFVSKGLHLVLGVGRRRAVRRVLKHQSMNSKWRILTHFPYSFFFFFTSLIGNRMENYAEMEPCFII